MSDLLIDPLPLAVPLGAPSDTNPVPHSVRITSFTFPALHDGFPIAATRFEPPSEVRLRAAVVFSPGTGTPARHYAEFATWLASQGIPVLTFDFRYTGRSWPTESDVSSLAPNKRADVLRAVPSDVGCSSHWARRDAAAATRVAAALWPDVSLCAVGHSLGGLLLPLYPEEHHLITRMMNIAGGNIFLGRHPRRKSLLDTFRKHVLPALKSDGIFHARRINYGEDLPRGVGEEWIRALAHPRGFARTKFNAQCARELRKPYLWVGFADDSALEKEQMEVHMAQLGHADRDKASIWIDPRTQCPPWPSCGHFESLASNPARSSRPNAVPLTREETVWRFYRDWIIDGSIDTSIGEYRVWGPDDEYDPLDRTEDVYELLPFTLEDEVDGKRVHREIVSAQL